MKKRLGQQKPWSDDPVFQKTYFCNVRREDDKVTQFIRGMYNRHVGHPLFEYNMVLARFLNRIETLERIGYQDKHDPKGLQIFLRDSASGGYTIWGNAYVITTHGMKMDKLTYLCQHVLEDVHSGLDSIRAGCRGVSCAMAAKALERIDGIGTFLSAQVVADLKNTPGHPLVSAEDRDSFVSPGPGSLRGLSWYFFGNSKQMTTTNFMHYFKMLQGQISRNWPEYVPAIDNQDLQNCLCEFDKYMRVRNGTGRSKRTYNGGPE